MSYNQLLRINLLSRLPEAEDDSDEPPDEWKYTNKK